MNKIKHLRAEGLRIPLISNEFCFLRWEGAAQIALGLKLFRDSSCDSSFEVFNTC